MTRFVRELSAIILHRLADRIAAIGHIAAAKRVQTWAFRAEFGGNWERIRNWHYATKAGQ
jgi:hypothetical protein